MTLNELKPKLVPAGILLLCYFAAPGLVQMFMGGNDAIVGGFTFSIIIKAGLGVAFAYKLFALRQPLNDVIIAWLTRFSQPQAQTLELAGQLSEAAVFIIIVALAQPVAVEIITGSWLLTLIKVSVLGYAVYLGRHIWRLAEPFMAYVPAAAPSAPPAATPELRPAPPAAPVERRCAKCGQLINDSTKFCAFCGEPVQPLPH